MSARVGEGGDVSARSDSGELWYLMQADMIWHIIWEHDDHGGHGDHDDHDNHDDHI